MKIVNEKGKLFGLINIIDLSIIILILVVGTVALFKFGGTGGVSIVNEDKQQEVTVTYRGVVRNDSQIKALKEGDQLISVTDPEEGYIKSISYNDLVVTNSTADGKQVTAVDPYRKELIVNFKMKASGGKGIIRLGTQEIAVGKEFTLKTHVFESRGTIEAIEFK